MAAEVAAVAAEHQPDEPAYGQTAYNATTGLVLWVAWDGTSNDEVEQAEKAFLEIDGVEDFDCEFEGLPSGWWEADVVYPENPPRWVVEHDLTDADRAYEALLALARSPLE